MAKQEINKKTTSKLKGELKELFRRCGEETVLKKIPGHVKLKDIDGNRVDMKIKAGVLSGIHENMAKSEFNAIANIIKRLSPKKPSKNERKRERYKAKALADRRHDGLS